MSVQRSGSHLYVRVVTAAGNVWVGRLLRYNAARVEVRVKDGTVYAVPLSRVAEIRPVPPPPQHY